MPAPGTWVRLVRRSGPDADPEPQGMWHLVRGWRSDRPGLVLACTARHRDLTWALSATSRYEVLRSLVEPDAEDEVCARCRAW